MTFAAWYVMKVDYEKDYPNRLRVIRRNLGYTQKQVSGWLGHKKATLFGKWESGTMMPSGTNLIKLSVLYGKDVQDMYPDFYRRVERHTVRPASELSRRRLDDSSAKE